MATDGKVGNALKLETLGPGGGGGGYFREFWIGVCREGS